MFLIDSLPGDLTKLCSFVFVFFFPCRHFSNNMTDRILWRPSYNHFFVVVVPELYFYISQFLSFPYSLKFLASHHGSYKVQRQQLLFSPWVTPDCMWPHGLYPITCLCPGDFPGKNTGVGCHFLLQTIFQTRGQTHISCNGSDSLPLSYQGSPIVTYDFQLNSVKKKFPVAFFTPIQLGSSDKAIELPYC